jgi:hypothetical protein
MKISMLTPIGTVLIVVAIAIYMMCFPGSEMLLTVFLVLVMVMTLLEICGWTESHAILFWIIFFAIGIFANSIAYETTTGTGGYLYLFEMPLPTMAIVLAKWLLLYGMALSGLCLLPNLFQKQ